MARSALASNPKVLPGNLYKNCHLVQKLQWGLTKTAWKKQWITSEWQQTIGAFIFKEQNCHTFSQFRSSLAEFVRKDVLLLSGKENHQPPHNKLIETQAGLGTNPLHEEREEWHMMWLVLTNTYCLVLQKLLDFAKEYSQATFEMRNYYGVCHLSYLILGSFWQPRM